MTLKRKRTSTTGPNAPAALSKPATVSSAPGAASAITVPARNDSVEPRHEPPYVAQNVAGVRTVRGR